MKRPMTLREAFEANVERGEETACWEWKGAKNRGWGVLQLDRVKRQAHRLSYEFHVGPVPDDLVLDHVCRNRGCVNPAHLEPVTNGENVLRGMSVPAQNARKTHCKRGHPLVPENLYPTKYGRRCKLCATDIRRAKKGQLDRTLFCRNGHPRTPENTYTYPGGDSCCLPCKQARGKLLTGKRYRVKSAA